MNLFDKWVFMFRTWVNFTLIIIQKLHNLKCRTIPQKSSTQKSIKTQSTSTDMLYYPRMSWKNYPKANSSHSRNGEPSESNNPEDGCTTKSTNQSHTSYCSGDQKEPIPTLASHQQTSFLQLMSTGDLNTFFINNFLYLLSLNIKQNKGCFYLIFYS